MPEKPLSPAQKRILARMEMGREYIFMDLHTTFPPLRTLVKLSYIETRDIVNGRGFVSSTKYKKVKDPEENTVKKGRKKMEFPSIGLVKYSCGCIGFKPDENGNAVIISACDSGYDEPEFSLIKRAIKKETYEPLPNEAEVVAKLARLVADGYSMRMVRIHLGVK